jgi:tetratricopeptide (TPR) repeat protein/DNA-binding CsgD family transcriptional regulator
MNNGFAKLHKHLKAVSKNIFILFVILIFCLPAIYGYSQHQRTILINQLSSDENDTSNIRIFHQIAATYTGLSKSQLDSSLFYLNKSLSLSKNSGSENQLYNTYDQYCKLFFKSGNYSIALDYCFKLLQLLDDKNIDNQDSISMLDKYVGLYAQMGTCYFKMNNNEKALSYYKQSLVGLEKIIRNNKDYAYLKKMVVLYTNIGSAYLSNYNNEAAQYNFEKALEYNATLKNPDFDASLYNNIGIIYKEKKELEKAFYYYNKSLEIRIQQKDTAGIAQTNNNLANAYLFVGDYERAIEILGTVLKMSEQTHSLISQMKAGEFLSEAYQKQGNYSKALEMYKLFKTLQDSILSFEQVQSILRLEMQYNFEKQRKEDELLQQILITKKERKALIYMIISAILFFSFTIVILLNRNQRIKMKQGKLLQDSLQLEKRNLSLEKQNLLMEKQNLELELEFRNKELSTHVMYLFKKNEFISSIISKLLAVKSKNHSEDNMWIMEILREMQSNVDNTVWEEFERRFQQVHEDFYEKLRLKYPDLTPNEIKICAFLKLNMTTKDISAITFQSVKSIQVARNRMRKKMGIIRDENLISIIQQL